MLVPTRDAAPQQDEPGWQRHLLTQTADIHALLERSLRIAVLGIKPDASKPAHYVPAYTQRAGYTIIPVPVYYPTITEILGEPVYRTISAVPGDIDIVNVFRRPVDIPPHVDDIIAKHPKAVWFQLGIRNDEAAERLARAGIDVVQDRCMLVELQAMGR
jgi:predicted CoA-binding protein